MTAKTMKHIDVTEKDGRIIMVPVKTNEFKLEDLLSAITEENQHGRIDFGPAVGKERGEE